MINLTLLIPGLLGSFAGLMREDKPQFPAVETLLAKANIQRVPSCSFYQTLCDLFDLEKPAAGDLPIAPLSRLVDDAGRPDGIWMRADPIHLAAGRDGVVLVDSSSLSLSQHDAIILAAALEGLFLEENWQLEIPLSKRWYIKLPENPDITTVEIDNVIARDIHPYMPNGPERNRWLRLMNEIQMLLHNCEINKEREKQGKLSINSLWLWGIGQLPEILPRQWTRIYSDEPVAQGLAMLSSAQFSELPENARDIINGTDTIGKVLIASTAIQADSRNQDYTDWLQSIEEMERHWFEPIINFIRQGKLREVVIISDGYRFTFDRHCFLKFWCLRKSIVDYLAE